MGIDIVFGIINFGDVFHGTYNRRGDFPYYRNLSSVGNQGRVLVRGEDLVDIRSVGSGDARGLAVDGECHYLDVAGRMGLFEQRKRVEKGWFPKRERPKNDKRGI